MKNKFRLFIFIFVLLNLATVPKLSASEEELLLMDRDAKISMDLSDASLKSVLKLLSIQSGLNFVASDTVQDRKLTLYLDRVPLRQAMDNIFKANNLTYDMDKTAGVFIVNDLGMPEVQTVTKVFYLKYATVSTSSLKEEMMNNLTGTTTSSTGASSSSSSGGGGSGSGGKWKAEDSSGITAIVSKLLSKDGIVVEDFRTNSLTVTDVPSRMAVISQVIKELDVPVSEIMLEVEMLDVSKNIVDNMGFKFGQTPLSVAITGSAASLGFPYAGWTKLFNGSDGSINVNDASTAGGSYKAQLDFLRTQTDTKFLARPRIRTLNNETAEIKITTQETIGILSSQSAGADPTTNTSAERTETGVSLRVTPQIDVESGEITMFIVPTVKDVAVSSIPIGGTGSVFYKDPEERSTKSTVRVKDGETIVLGGLLRNQTSTVITKLPVLGDIPLLGLFFRHKSLSPGKVRELLVFITPHIIKTGKTELDYNKKIVIPQREQAAVSILSKQQSVSSYMNSFEVKR